MADVLSVIADIIKQDKQQKREHAKIMREVQKKLKEKETDASEDVSDFMGAASQAAADGKKEFEFPPGSGKMYPVTIKDKDTAKKIAKKMDDKDEETSLSQRVKSRMKAEDEMPPKEEDEDDDPVGDEPSEDQIDKIADLVVQKLKDKADEEEDEEDEPEETEAEKGEEEEINTRPKMEAVKNPHARNTWEEALRKVYFKEEKVPEPIPEVIKSVGKELRNYAMKSGGIDRDDFLKISKTLMQGKMPKANMINKMDTDPREFVFDLMAKTMGWKYVEQYGGIRFQHRTDYVESFQGGHVLQEHCGECGAMDHVDEKFKKGKYTLRDGKTGKVIATYNSGAKAAKEMEKLFNTGKYDELDVKMEEEVEIDEKKMFSGKGEFEVKYASSKRGPIKVSKFNTLDDAKKFLAQVKGEGMNGIISKGGKPVKEDEDLEKIVKELEKASQTHLGQSKRIKKHLDKMKEDVEQEIEESAALQMKMAADDIETYAKKHGGIDKKDMMKAASMLKKGDKKGALKFIKTLDTDPRDYLLKTMGEEVEIDEKASDYEDQIKAFLAKGGKIQKGDRPNKRKIDMVTKGFMKKYGAMKKKEADLDAKDKEELEKMMGEAVVNEAWIDNDAKKIQSKWKKMDKRAKKKWMDGIMAKAKKEGMPKDEVMDVLDDYGLVENFNEESIGIRFVRKHYQKDKESI